MNLSGVPSFSRFCPQSEQGGGFSRSPIWSAGTVSVSKRPPPELNHIAVKMVASGNRMRRFSVAWHETAEVYLHRFVMEMISVETDRRRGNSTAVNGHAAMSHVVRNLLPYRLDQDCDSVLS